MSNEQSGSCREIFVTQIFRSLIGFAFFKYRAYENGIDIPETSRQQSNAFARNI